MAIVLKKPGEAALAAGAGKAIGEAQKKQQEKDDAMRIASENRANQWELEKATMRSQQEFQQELQNRQFQMDIENRAKSWEIEKMELASRLDFQREERKRQMALDETDNKIKAIKKAVESGQITKDKADNLMFSIQYDVPYSALAKESEGQSYGTLPGEQQYLTEEERKNYNRDKLLNQPDKIGAIPWYLSPKDVNTKAGIDAQREAGIYMDETERLARAKNVVASTATPQQIVVTPPPVSIEDFESKVAALILKDEAQAKEYYDRYVGKF